MNVLFVNYHDFHSNSATHIFNLAGHLGRLGVSCAVCVPDRKKTVVDLGEPTFAVLDYADARRGRFGFNDRGAPDLIHAWTPRELVRKLTTELAAAHSIPYFVHLEDNEDVLAADQLGIARDRILAASDAELAGLSDHLSHPRRFREFLGGAAGVSVIIDRLAEFVPPGVPTLELWPASEEELFYPRPPLERLRRKLGLNGSDSVVVYAGNVHSTNAAEVRSLYLALALVTRRGSPVTLVRLGRDYCNFMGEAASLVRDRVVQVNFRPRSELPDYYALADVLVQPGRADDFNDFRIPSKLPEFFAMGLPVVLPATNVGRYAKDGEECLLLERGDALDIGEKLERLLRDEALRQRIGAGGRRFAEERFSWRASAERLRAFYVRFAAERSPLPHPDLGQVVERYRSYEAAPLSYATVRDYCDSADYLPSLATASGDLKDVQRPWALKAILGRLPIGARLLEVGAGDPYVADILGRIGYDVTLVDPYDGRDQGPTSYDSIVAAYPHLTVVRGIFPDALDQTAGSFDCIYSISVLEHLAKGAIPHVWEGIRRLTTPSGVTIHAIDHVHKGPGDDDHRARLDMIVRAAGIDAESLDQVISRLDGDAETYFLSAEGHNRWRGTLPYDEFAMRRCVSIQLCVPV